MTDTVRQEILSLHNELRSLVARGLEPRLAGLTASEMLRLEWDEELARGAQLWADQCIFQHDNNDICRSEVNSTDLEVPSNRLLQVPSWSEPLPGRRVEGPRH